MKMKRIASRRIFYIDVGHLTPRKQRALLKKLMEEVRQPKGRT